jgi:hypothetical protein
MAPTLPPSTARKDSTSGTEEQLALEISSRNCAAGDENQVLRSPLTMPTVIPLAELSLQKCTLMHNYKVNVQRRIQPRVSALLQQFPAVAILGRQSLLWLWQRNTENRRFPLTWGYPPIAPSWPSLMEVMPLDRLLRDELEGRTH